MSKPTITASITSYNDEGMISSCLESALAYADAVIISDGTFFTETNYVKDDSILCQPSVDDTRHYIEKFVSNPKLTFMDMSFLPQITETEYRNTHLQMCDTDYFLIQDSDEVWDGVAWQQLIDEIEKDDGKTDDFNVGNHLYFWDPYHWVDNKLRRLFKNTPGRSFYGINELTFCKNEKIIWPPFYSHYGYIDNEKVRNKLVTRYTDGYYRGCGKWWYENIFLAFDGTNEEELFKKNFNTIHPWGKIHPGFAADEFTIKKGKEPTHPIYIRQWLLAQGFDTYNIKFIP
jgi:hypothetical protein